MFALKRLLIVFLLSLRGLNWVKCLCSLMSRCRGSFWYIHIFIYINPLTLALTWPTETFASSARRWWYEVVVIVVVIAVSFSFFLFFFSLLPPVTADFLIWSSAIWRYTKSYYSFGHGLGEEQKNTSWGMIKEGPRSPHTDKTNCQTMRWGRQSEESDFREEGGKL